MVRARRRSDRKRGGEGETIFFALRVIQIQLQVWPNTRSGEKAAGLQAIAGHTSEKGEYIIPTREH